jgi:hypothetical protein
MLPVTYLFRGLFSKRLSAWDVRKIVHRPKDCLERKRYHCFDLFIFNLLQFFFKYSDYITIGFTLKSLKNNTSAFFPDYILAT